MPTYSAHSFSRSALSDLVLFCKPPWATTDFIDGNIFLFKNFLFKKHTWPLFKKQAVEWSFRRHLAGLCVFLPISLTIACISVCAFCYVKLTVVSFFVVRTFLTLWPQHMCELQPLVTLTHDHLLTSDCAASVTHAYTGSHNQYHRPLIRAVYCNLFVLSRNHCYNTSHYGGSPTCLYLRFDLFHIVRYTARFRPFFRGKLSLY